MKWTQRLAHAVDRTTENRKYETMTNSSSDITEFNSNIMINKTIKSSQIKVKRV